VSRIGRRKERHEKKLEIPREGRGICSLENYEEGFSLGKGTEATDERRERCEVASGDHSRSRDGPEGSMGRKTENEKISVKGVGQTVGGDRVTGEKKEVPLLKRY